MTTTTTGATRATTLAITAITYAGTLELLEPSGSVDATVVVTLDGDVVVGATVVVVIVTLDGVVVGAAVVVVVVSAHLSEAHEE